MNEYLLPLISQLGRFLVIILSGFLTMKLKWLTRDDFNAIARLVVKILLPLFLITTIPAAGTRQDLIDSLPLIASSFVAVICLFLIARLTATLLRLPDPMTKVHIICTGISNIGFMAVPLGEALFGAPGILAGFMYALANDITLWTVGKNILTGRPPQDQNEKAGRKKFKFNRSWLQFFNRGMAGALIGCLLLAFNVNPQGVIIWDALGILGSMARYLPLFFIGGVMATIDLSLFRKHLAALSIVLTKMIMMPLAAYYLSLLLLPSLSDLRRVMLTLCIGMPTFTLGSSLAATYGGDEKYAASCITITTLASMLTLPFVLWVVSII